MTRVHLGDLKNEEKREGEREREREGERERGKGMHDIDVLGLNKNNQVIAAQVSYTDNVSTIKGKYKSLLNYKYADKYILCTLKNKEEVSTFMNIDNDNLTIISLNDIWKDFNNSRMK